MRREAGHPIEATERWFLAQGLTYFVPEQRAAARAALRPRRALAALLLTVLLAAGAGLGLAATVGPSAAPGAALTVGLLAALGYALTAVRAAPIAGWALGRTLGSLRFLLPMASRALPLLLVFVTFLFINAEAWQMTASLRFSVLWLTVVLLIGFAVLFLLVRLPEEVDRVDDEVDDAFLAKACAGTPLERAHRDLRAGDLADPASYATVTGFERWNLILVLLMVQTIQVLLLAVSVFVFFVLFGSLVMTEGVQQAWTGIQGHSAPVLSNVSTELVKVSLFLAAFSGLYFTVSAITDDTYRSQFFAAVTEELERAVGVRAVYLALREVTSGDDRAPTGE